MKKAVWIDRKEACFIKGDGSTLWRKESPIESQERYEGETSQQGRFGDQFVNPEKGKEERFRHQVKEFTSLVADELVGAEEILVFGPAEMKKTVAKTLKEDHRFKDTAIHLESADSMTENQLCAFVRDYFSPPRA